jgi:hypothetical protein
LRCFWGVLEYLGGELLQHFNVSGFQGKNLSTEQVCQAEAVNFSIAFGPRPNTPVPTPKTAQGCCLSPVSLFPLLQWIAGCEV